MGPESLCRPNGEGLPALHARLRAGARGCCQVTCTQGTHLLCPALQELVRRVISFKDLRLVSTDFDEPGPSASEFSDSEPRRRSNPSCSTSSNIDAHTPSGVTVNNGRLAVIMVGLPARGKTFLCNKLLAYLNWCAARHRGRGGACAGAPRRAGAVGGRARWAGHARGHKARLPALRI